MNKIFGAISGFFLLIVIFGSAMVKPVSANEGVVSLRGLVKGACFASSIYFDGNYHIMMTCRELLTAISPEKNRYIVWIEDVSGKVKRIGEIVNGKMSTISDVKYVKMFVTAELTDFSPKPSDDLILAGQIEPIDFGKNIASTPFPTPTVAVSVTTSPTSTVAQSTPKATITPKITSTATTSSTSGLGSALSTIFKIALFGFGLLLVIVGVFSFLQRRRSL